MLIRLLQAINRIATGRNVLLFFLFLLPFAFFFFPWRTGHLQAITGYPFHVFDTRLPYTPQEVHALAGDLGENGRRLYAISEVTLDFAFPLLYATWLSVSLAWVWGAAHPDWTGFSRLALLPYLGMLGDLAENACLASLMLLFPKGPDWLVWVSNLASLSKWIAGLASIGLILAGSGIYLFNKLITRSDKSQAN